MWQHKHSRQPVWEKKVLRISSMHLPKSSIRVVSTKDRMPLPDAASTSGDISIGPGLHRDGGAYVRSIRVCKHTSKGATRQCWARAFGLKACLQATMQRFPRARGHAAFS